MDPRFPFPDHDSGKRDPRIAYSTPKDLGLASVSNLYNRFRRRLMRPRLFDLWIIVFLFPVFLHAAIFGNVRGIVHDPTDSSIPGAQVTIRSRTSNWSQTTATNADGTFQFDAVPVGEYTVSVMASGFSQA